MSALDLARPDLAGLPAVGRVEPDGAALALDANEVPWRPAGDRSERGLNLYPPVRASALAARLGELYGVPADSVLPARGSDEAIDLLTRAFCRPERDAVLVLPPTFGMYALAARVQGARVVAAPRRREEGFRIELDEVARRLDEDAVKLVFVPDPDNPTGRLAPGDEIEALADLCAGRALLVVDEAYREFADAASAAGRLDDWPHLVVLRTLSKAHALAGARCGAALARPEVVDLLGRLQPPFALAQPSIEAALEQLGAPALAATRRRICRLVRERERLAAELAALPAVRTVFPSAANFLLVAFRDREEAESALRTAGVTARCFDAPELVDCLRLTVGGAAARRRVIAALEAA